MFTNKSRDGSNNICGKRVAHYRKAMGKSQRELADALQLSGLDIDKNAIQRLEAGKRFVTDIELVYLAKLLKVTYEDLLDETEQQIWACLAARPFSITISAAIPAFAAIGQWQAARGNF